MAKRQTSKTNKTNKNKPTPAKCPVCGEPIPSDSPERPAGPFCSKRCQQIDLGKWLDGAYKVSRPIEQADLDEV